MRQKFFHGTSTVTCANSVLQEFMRHPSLLNPANRVSPQPEIQIADPHRALERHVNIGFVVRWHRMNWSQLRMLDD